MNSTTGGKRLAGHEEHHGLLGDVLGHHGTAVVEVLE
jgi:hypothetical protein